MSAQQSSQMFAVLVPCDGRDLCPEWGSRHGHVDGEPICSCGAVVTLDGIINEQGATGDALQYPIVYHPSGEWLVRCPGCGTEHVLVEAEG